MKNNCATNKKDVGKKAIAIGAALSVVAGIGATTLDNGQEVQAKATTAKTSARTSSSTESNTKRPTSNATKSSTEKSTRTSSGRVTSGRENTSAERRKSQAKIINSQTSDETTTEENTNENESQTSESKRPTKSYKSIEEKKQDSKAKVQRNIDEGLNQNSDNSRIVIKVSTK